MIGLGNPEPAYRGTRHNVGAAVVRELARRLNTRWERQVDRLVATRGRVLLCLPLSFMNRSGTAVARLLSESGALPSEMVVVCDDVNLPLGRIRLRRRGSDGGHKGLRSIIEALNTQEFPRLRLGVGRPAGPEELEQHVLAPFAPSELARAEAMVQRAADAVRCWWDEGPDAAMALFNAPQGEDV